MGYWTRKQTEQCWLFTRGAPKRLSKGVEQIIHCPRGAHSAKPEQQYGLIEALVGGPYLEMFARTTRPGWTAWGDQVGVRDSELLA
jgi:N6-adenosine-specific RNA methylase IME4